MVYYWGRVFDAFGALAACRIQVYVVYKMYMQPGLTMLDGISLAILSDWPASHTTLRWKKLKDSFGPMLLLFVWTFTKTLPRSQKPSCRADVQRLNSPPLSNISNFRCAYST